MSVGNSTPKLNWGEAQSEAQQPTIPIGCAMCAFEENDNPLTQVFFWGGSSYCINHLLALRTQ